MGVKDNFSQAFKEIMAKAVQEEDLKSTLDNAPNEFESKILEAEPVQATKIPPKPSVQEPIFNPIKPEPVINSKPDTFSAGIRGDKMDLGRVISENSLPTTVISKGTSIVGEIKSDSNVEMLGTIQGNIETTGNVKISGKVAGNVKGDNIELLSCSVQGDIIARSGVKINSDSVTVGNVTASTLEMDGKLKGNVQIKSVATINKNALLLGNISSAQISVNEGAKILGEIRITIDPETEKLFEQAMHL